MRIARGAVAAVGAALSSGCGIFGGGDSTVEPPAELQQIEARIEIERVWRARVGSGFEALRLGLGPSTDGERVYVGAHDGGVVALDAQTGREVWEVDTGLPLSAGPGYGAGLLAFGTTDGYLVLLDAQTGEERWRVPVGAEVLADPAVSANVVALRSSDGRLRGFSIRDGSELWAVDQSLPALIVRGDTEPELADSVVVVGFDNGRLGAYRLASGEPVWELPIGAPAGRTELDRLVDVGEQLTVLGNDVYAVGYQGRVVAVDLNTGLLLWQQEMSSLAGLEADSSRVYVTTDVDRVVALARSDGRRQWMQDALRRRELTAPTRYRNTVVVGDLEGYLHWLDIDDGSFAAREQAASARITEPPIIAGEYLVVQAEDGSVVAYTVVEEQEDEGEGD